MAKRGFGRNKGLTVSDWKMDKVKFCYSQNRNISDKKVTQVPVGSQIPRCYRIIKEDQNMVYLKVSPLGIGICGWRGYCLRQPPQVENNFSSTSKGKIRHLCKNFKPLLGCLILRKKTLIIVGLVDGAFVAFFCFGFSVQKPRLKFMFFLKI